MQKWLNDNDISMYSIHNESKSVDAKRFVKTPKGKTYKKWQLIFSLLFK